MDARDASGDVAAAEHGAGGDEAGGQVAGQLPAGALLFPAGLLVQAVGLYRAQAAPALSAIGLGLFAVAMAVGHRAFSTPLLVAGFVVLTAALAPLGWAVLEEGDEAWEHTPTFRGFRAQPA